MRAFTFRLQVVLDRARDEEEACLARLAEMQGEMTRKEAEIVSTRDARNTLLEVLAASGRGPLDARELAQSHLHLASLSDDLVHLETERAEIATRVETARQLLVGAMQKRQVLEKVREKRYTEYCREVARQELQAMEETTLPRLARERAEEIARWRHQQEGRTRREEHRADS